MKPNTQKTIYLGAASFILSVLSSLTLIIGSEWYFVAFFIFILFFAAACACAGLFALTSLVSPSKIYVLIVPAAAACAGLICTSVSAAVLSLTPFAAGAVIAVAAKRRSGKTGAIVVADLCVGVVLIASFAVSYYAANKTLAPSAVVGSIKDVFSQIEAEMASVFENVGLYALYAKIYDLSDMTKETFSSELAREVMFTVKAISPAVIITCLNIFSYVATAFFSLSCRVSKTELAIPDGKWRLFPSAISAWIYLGSMLAYVFMNTFSRLSDSAVLETLYYAALNLMIILLAPMLICGVRGIVGRFRSPMHRRSATILTVLCAVLLFFNLFYGLAFAALEGAWDIINLNRLKKSGNRQE